MRLQAGGGRVIGIFLDEFHVQAGDTTMRARAALTQFVDTHLRDGDTVALVKPLDPLHAITFTQDRDAIRKVIAGVRRHAGDYTPRSEFEHNFISRDPRTAEATRAQVVTAALQALARAARRAAAGAQSAHLRQRRIQAGAAARHHVRREPQRRRDSTRSIRIPRPADDESMLRSLAEQTGGAASINDADLAPALDAGPRRSRSHFVLTSLRSGHADGNSIRCRYA